MNIDTILKGNILKIWSKFIITSVIGVVFNAIYTLVDGIFVGQGVGEVGLASVNIVWPAVTVILAVGALLGTGASSIISIYIGKKEIEKAEKVLGTTIKAGVIIGIVLTIIGIIGVEPIIRVLGAKEDTFQFTKDYYIIIYCMALPYIFSSTLNPIVRAAGSPQLSMWMVGIGAICNVILDWIFVINLGWGTKGAALATGASIILSTIISFSFFIKGKSYIRLKLKYVKIDKNILKNIIKTGFVLFAVQLSVGIVILVQNNVIYWYGNTTDMAIYSAAGYIISLYIQLCLGISQGMQPLIGYHYGANSLKRMRQLLTITLGVCVVTGILAYFLLYKWGYPIIEVFGIKGDILALAYERILIFCMGIPITGVIYTMGAYYQATKRNVQANIISIGRGCVLQILFTIILPPFMGVTGIFYAQSLSDIAALFVLFAVILVEKKCRKLGIRERLE